MHNFQLHQQQRRPYLCEKDNRSTHYPQHTENKAKGFVLERAFIKATCLKGAFGQLLRSAYRSVDGLHIANFGAGG